MPSEVFDRPNPNLGVPPFVTREFFSQRERLGLGGVRQGNRRDGEGLTQVARE